MAITTCKKFTYAKVSDGGDGSAMTYTGGTMLEDYLAKVDINEERTDEKEYADGHLIDSEKIPTGVEMTLELVNNNDGIREDVLGMTDATTELQLSEADPPFVGAGVMMASRFKGNITWEAYWIYKIQFAMQGKSAETRRDRTSFQHETISGNGMGVSLTPGGTVVYYAFKSGMTESAAITWLKGHAGIQT